jgi:hypothetical protein
MQDDELKPEERQKLEEISGSHPETVGDILDEFLFHEEDVCRNKPKKKAKL